MINLKGMYQVMNDKISSPREFFGLVAAIVVATVSCLAWANSSFITPAKAETMHNDVVKQLADADIKMSKEIQKLTEQVQKSNTKLEITNNLMIVHMDKHALETVIKSIEDNQSEQFRNDQFIGANGSNPQMDARQQKLKRDLDALEMKKTCILNNNPLCD